jgi:hypothetical protein
VFDDSRPSLAEDVIRQYCNLWQLTPACVGKLERWRKMFARQPANSRETDIGGIASRLLRSGFQGQFICQYFDKMSSSHIPEAIMQDYITSGILAVIEQRILSC